MRRVTYPKSILKIASVTTCVMFLILHLRIDYKKAGIMYDDVQRNNEIGITDMRYGGKENEDYNKSGFDNITTASDFQKSKKCDCFLDDNHEDYAVPQFKQSFEFYNNSIGWKIDQRIRRGEVNITGIQRSEINYLSIAVPSIRRMNGYVYLIHTLQSLINETTTEEKQSIVVLIFLADLDERYNNKVAEILQRKFHEYFDMGFLQILRIAPENYPTLENLKQNFDDSIERVRWRSKQVIDYAVLFSYAQNKSKFYLQLEDDVLCAPNFIKIIKQFISRHPINRWTMASFSSLGFIGKLFKNNDLPRLAAFMFMFYEEQPVDWLMVYFRQTMGQHIAIQHRPSLFQHMGRNSSFGNASSENTLTDRFFIQNEQHKTTVDYPKATLYSTMTPFHGYHVKFAYLPDSLRFFWAMDPVVNDSISIVLDQPANLSNIFINTGHADHPSDILKNGIVQVCAEILSINDKTGDVTCIRPVTLGKVDNGRFSNNNITSLFSHPIKCIVIKVTEQQDTWIAFTQIGVEVSKR